MATGRRRCRVLGNRSARHQATGSRWRQLGAQMTTSRRETLWGLIATHAAGQGRRVSVAGMCAVAVSCVQGTGAWVTAASGQGPDFVMRMNSPVSEQLAELQLTLGQGPGHDVLASATPPLADDIDDEEPGSPVGRAHGGGRQARRPGGVRVPAGHRRTSPSPPASTCSSTRSQGRQLLPRPRPAAALSPGADPRVVWAQPRGK